MKKRLITVGLLASIFSVAYVAPASAQEDVASLTLYGAGLPPGPFNAYPDVNPLPPLTFQIKTFAFPLAGTEQIPLDAVIKWVKIGSMTHGRFDEASPEAGATVRLFMSNGSSTYPVTPSGQFGLEAYGLDNEYNTGGGFSLSFSPFTNTAWTRDEVANLTVGWWGRWASGSLTAWAQRLSVIAYPVEVGFQVPGSPASYSVSPPTLNLSTGDTNRFITTTASRPTVRFTPTFTIGSTSNPNSSCAATLTFAQTTGTGTVNSNVRASPAGCSTIANNVRSRVGGISSTNSSRIVVPPQVMIKTAVGETGGLPLDSDQHSILIVARNRLGDNRFPGGRTATWQAVLIPDEFYGADNPTNNGPDRELRNSAQVFTGEIGDIVGGSQCAWSPTNTQWNLVLAAFKSGTTTFPTGTGAPDCYQANRRQIVHKTSISLNTTHGPNYSSAPAFVFVRERATNAPAVVQIP